MNRIPAFRVKKIPAKSEGGNVPSSPAAAGRSRQQPSAGVSLKREWASHLDFQGCCSALRKVTLTSPKGIIRTGHLTKLLTLAETSNLKPDSAEVFAFVNFLSLVYLFSHRR